MFSMALFLWSARSAGLSEIGNFQGKKKKKPKQDSRTQCGFWLKMANSHQIFNLSFNYMSGSAQVAVMEVGAVGNWVTKMKNTKIASHAEQIFTYPKVSICNAKGRF